MLQLPHRQLQTLGPEALSSWGRGSPPSIPGSTVERGTWWSTDTCLDPATPKSQSGQGRAQVQGAGQPGGRASYPEHAGARSSPGTHGRLDARDSLIYALCWGTMLRWLQAMLSPSTEPWGVAGGSDQEPLPDPATYWLPVTAVA